MGIDYQEAKRAREAERALHASASGAPFFIFDGDTITAHSLPAPDGRFTPRRRRMIAHAIERGVLGLDEAAKRYRATHDELLSWIAQIT